MVIFVAVRVISLPLLRAGAKRRIGSVYENHYDILMNRENIGLRYYSDDSCFVAGGSRCKTGRIVPRPNTEAPAVTTGRLLTRAAEGGRIGG